MCFPHGLLGFASMSTLPKSSINNPQQTGHDQQPMLSGTATLDERRFTLRFSAALLYMVLSSLMLLNTWSPHVVLRLCIWLSLPICVPACLIKPGLTGGLGILHGFWAVGLECPTQTNTSVVFLSNNQSIQTLVTLY